MKIEALRELASLFIESFQGGQRMFVVRQFEDRSDTTTGGALIALVMDGLNADDRAWLASTLTERATDNESLDD